MTTDSAPAGPTRGQFGRHLRIGRVRAGFTQQQLALRVGYHHSLISRLEAGLREPPVPLVPRLDSVLKTGGELALIVAAPRQVPDDLPRRPLAGVSLAMTLGGVILPASLASAAPATAPPTSTPKPTPAALAIAAADQATRSGVDALAKGPDEQYDRSQVTPWTKNLYSVAYERTYKGLPVVGGDAVVLADGKGKVRALRSAADVTITVPTKAKVTEGQAVRTSRAGLAKVDKVDSKRLVVRVKNDRAALAWETVLTGRTKADVPSRLHVFVNARTGKVVDTYDDVRAGTGHSEWNGPDP